MRAAFSPRYGAPDAVEVRELPRPRARGGRAARSGARRRGQRRRHDDPPRHAALRTTFSRALPSASGDPPPGTGFAGVVEALGEGVTGIEVGTAVFGETTLGFAAQAEYLTIPADGVVLTKPDDVPFAEAAVACDGAVTSLCLLEDSAGLRPGERLLVNGAAGAQGVAAVQIGKRLGAHVTAVASARNHDFASALGADVVIDYNALDFASIGERWDVIHDTVGTRRFGDVRVALAEGGRYVSGVLNLELLASMLWTHRVGSRRALFSATGLKPAPELRERLGRVAGMLVDGSLRLPIERHYPLAEIAEAHRYIDGGHKRGNLVIDMIGVFDREDENIAIRGVTSEPVDGHDKRARSTAASKTPS